MIKKILFILLVSLSVFALGTALSNVQLDYLINNGITNTDEIINDAIADGIINSAIDPGMEITAADLNAKFASLKYKIDNIPVSGGGPGSCNSTSGYAAECDTSCDTSTVDGFKICRDKCGVGQRYRYDYDSEGADLQTFIDGLSCESIDCVSDVYWINQSDCQTQTCAELSTNTNWNGVAAATYQDSSCYVNGSHLGCKISNDETTCVETCDTGDVDKKCNPPATNMYIANSTPLLNLSTSGPYPAVQQSDFVDYQNQYQPILSYTSGNDKSLPFLDENGNDVGPLNVGLDYQGIIGVIYQPSLVSDSNATPPSTQYGRCVLMLWYIHPALPTLRSVGSGVVIKNDTGNLLQDNLTEVECRGLAANFFGVPLSSIGVSGWSPTGQPDYAARQDYYYVGPDQANY